MGFKSFLKYATGVLLLLALLSGTFFAALQTDRGKALFASVLSKALSSQPDQVIAIGRVEGMVPFAIQVDRVSVSDPGGTWITAENIILRWSFLALLTGRIHIEELSLSSLDLKRLTPKREEPKTVEGKVPPWVRDLPLITIDRLSIRDLLLDQGVLGQKATFALHAGISESSSEKGRTVTFHLKRTDSGPETSVDVDITLGGSPPLLSVQAVVRDENEGLTGTALGLSPGPVHLTFQGGGPLTEWNAALQGSAGAYGAITAEITMKAQEDIVISANGKLDVAKSLLPVETASVPGDINYFGLTAQIDFSRYIRVGKAWISGKGFHSEFSGSLDLLSREIRSDWSFTMSDLGTLSHFTGASLQGDLTARGTLSAKFHQPHGTASLLFRKLKINNFAATEIQSDIQLQPLKASAPDHFGSRLIGTTKARDLSILDNAPVAESLLGWTLEFHQPPGEKQIIATFGMEHERNRLDLTARIDPEERSATLDASVRVHDSRPLAAIIAKPLPEELSLEVHLAGAQNSRTASGNFTAKLGNVEGMPQPAPGILGPETAFRGDFEVQGERLNVRELSITSPAMNITSKAVAILSDKTINGEWNLRVPLLERLSSPSGISLGGNLEAEGSFTGPFNALEHFVTMKAKDLAVQGKKIQTATAGLHVAEIPAAPRGNFRIALRTNGDSLSASTDFKMDDGKLALSVLGISIPGAKIKGDIVLDIKKRIANGNLEGQVENLAAIGRMTGEQLTGSGKFQVSLAAGKKGQDVKASVNGANITTPLGNVKKLELSADLKDALDTPNGNLTLQVRELHRADLNLDSTLNVSGDRNVLSFSNSIRGQYLQKFDLNSRGDITLAKGRDQLRLGTFEGRMGEHRFNLLAPATVQRKGESISSERIALAFGPGTVNASGSFDPRQIRLDARFEKIPIDRSTGLNVPDLFASATGKIRLEGSLSSPSVSLETQLLDIRMKKRASRGAQISRMDIQADIAAGNLKATAKLQSAAQGSVTARVSVPVTFSITPFAAAIPPEGRLQGDLDGQTELAWLASLIPGSDHEFTGRTAARFNIRGTVANPDVSGNVTVQNGTYQNLSQGTVLKNLDIDVAARGRRLEIQKATATDGEKGSLTARGSVLMEAGTDFPVDLDVTLSKMAVIRRPDATGSVDGSLKVTGSTGKMALTGQLQFGPAEISIQRSQPPSVAQLDVIEIHGTSGVSHLPKEKTKKSIEQGPAVSSPSLDLTIGMPGGIFVRGRGLDSEWKGDLRITGPTDAPAITGNLTSIRGTFDFLGKRFSVASGLLQFFGSVPPAPVIDVTAESRAKEITARIMLRGPVAGPEIKLDSDPPMPPDEILARILFNRAAGNITPMQALRLADGLRALSGRGHTLDFLGRTREFLGLGQLELRETGKKEGMGLGIGKYLTEDIYVDVEKGIAEDTTKGSVRIELTPNLTVQTEAGLEGSQGIGVQWKHDY